MSYLSVFIHLVWTTKYRTPVLDQSIRKKVFRHIKENAKLKDIDILIINGTADHVHCLISLKVKQNIDWVVMLLKGESSFWINKNKLTRFHFEWQTEYGAFSVSPSGKNKVYHYILNQEEHHRKKSFQKEYDCFDEED